MDQLFGLQHRRTDPVIFNHWLRRQRQVRQGATGIIMKIHFSFVKFKVY